MERSSRRFVGWAVSAQRTKVLFESLVDAAPVAKNYYSDQFSVWMASWYPGLYKALPNKSQTYSVEGGNAELRHYLARLTRQSRCFSRRIDALSRTVDLFVRAWNERQEFKQKYPKLKPNLIDFVSL